jgi:integrase
MPTLYRPKVTTYTLPDGSYRTPDGERVTSKTPGAKRTVTKSKTWFGRYTDGAGQRHQVKLSESKETARRMLAKLAGDAQLAGVGIADKYAEHRLRPLVCPRCGSRGETADGRPCDCPDKPHLTDYRRYLAGHDKTAKYVGKTVAHVAGIAGGCGFGHTDDLDAAAVVDFLAGLREARPLPPLPPGQEWFPVEEAAALLGVSADWVQDVIRTGPLPPGPPPLKRPGKTRCLHRDVLGQLRERRSRGLSVRTSNDWLGSVKRFSKWLVKDGRAAADPLAHLSRLNHKVDVRHPRRALGEADFARFVESTAAGRPFRGLAGPDRLVLYTLAANTGFRAGELSSLTPASFAFDASPPTVTVEAAFSKHRREDLQPLRPDVAEMMRQYVAGKGRREPIWPGKWALDGAQMVRRDLEAAGLPYEDEAGRSFDFHALRGQFITSLAAKGVHPKVAQVLARHSTITLTMDYYTRLEIRDVAGALDQLPRLAGQPGAPGQEPPKSLPA